MAVNRPYTPRDWETGDIITEEFLDNIEEGISAIDSEIYEARGLNPSSTTLKQRIDDLVIIQNTKPTSDNNKIWIKGTSNSVRVPTYDEFDNLNKNSVRVDRSQPFTTEQKNTGRDNINAASMEDLINMRADFDRAQDEAVASYATNLWIDTEANLLYLLNRNGEPISDGVVAPTGGGGGGGGGGGSEIGAVMNAQNTSGWISKTIAQNAKCELNFVWSSLENSIETGPGILTVTISKIGRAVINIPQGPTTIDVSQWLSLGSNPVELRITDIYAQSRVLRYNINVIALSISSTFDTSVPFTDDITFTYTPRGNLYKTIHFVLDGEEYMTRETSATDTQLTTLIPFQEHGAHTLEVYMTATLNEEPVESNHLFYEFICSEPGYHSPIIASSFNETEFNQYDTVIIPYRVYKDDAMTVSVQITLNGVQVADLTVDRSEQNFTFRAERAGTTIVSIVAGTAEKTFTLTIAPSDIKVEPITEALQLHMSSNGRSNSEALAQRIVWPSSVGNIEGTLSGFNWQINGWMKDDDGIDVLRLADTARVNIPFQIFGSDFKTTGKTIEIEFATREVVDYNAVILSCFSDNIGLKVTPQSVMFKGAQTTADLPYKDNEHIRLSITVGKQNDYRTILVYIDGIMSRAIQYQSGERFDQLTPVGISIGSSDCGIDIYNIRVYSNDLTRREIVNNWIADTQIGSLLIDRYTRNNIYDENGNITIETLPSNLPYFILEAEELPQYKGDKKTISGSYVDPVQPSKSFTFTGCQINVQGTSSAVYYRKNYDLQFKEGFTTTAGHIDNYMLKDNSIPFNRFVLKADVASSESANNTVLSTYFSDVNPYKNPQQIANPKVRQGIEGLPIVVFWYDTANEKFVFLGKHNFNLPKRASAPYGYDNEEDEMESWEVERNNSLNVKFQDNDFTTQAWDEVEQQYYPEWYDDFEARFPSDEWRDTTKLNEFLSWVKSTYRDAATGDDLPEEVTWTFGNTNTVDLYPDDQSYTVTGTDNNKIITFTKDTPAYRLSKFRAEFSNYADILAFVYYYNWTHLLLMIDSRAKNMFLGLNGTPIEDDNRAMNRHATAEPYDMDTAIGTNNSGVLMFGYSLEDTDTVSSIISGNSESGSNAPVYNAQDSVLWTNLRDAFRPEITQNYRDMRASGAWSYAMFNQLFTEHQSKWPEALVNEDMYIKYLVPLVDPVTYDEDSGRLIRTDRYLTMLQGLKTQQRRWWLSNRFRYFDSKYVTGDASGRIISMRVFGSGTLSVTPITDLYVGVSFGGGTTPSLQRTTAGTPASFTYDTGSTVTEMETWVYSADRIKSLGNLAPLYINELDASKATVLEDLIIGSSDSEYTNPNLTTIDVSNCKLLEKIDCRNCPRLGITVNLEGSPRLKEAYFEGTTITGVDLADGAAVEHLHLPSTITTLTLMNLNKLTDLQVESYANVTRVMLTNMDQDVINPVTVLNAIPANSQVNIQGLELDLDNVAAIESFYDLLDTMKGVTRERNTKGEWSYYDSDNAIVSGHIHTDTINGDQLEEFNNRYPYINITADHISYKVSYYDYDGGNLLYSVEVVENGDAIDPVATGAISAPTRTGTDTVHYVYNGWCTLPTNIQGNTIVYAQWLEAYRVRWLSDTNGTALQTSYITRGQNGSYTGSTPTKAQTAQYTYTFKNWSGADNTTTGAVNNVTAVKDVIATYTATVRTYTVTFKNDDNKTVLQTINNVAYGTTPSYTGSTPTSTDSSMGGFQGWEPAIGPITGNTTYVATYQSPVEDVEITGDWASIIDEVIYGTYSSNRKIGNYKALDLGTEGTPNMQIVAMDADVDAEGNTIPLTFVAKEQLLTEHNMNSSNANVGGYPASAMKTYMSSTIKNLIPSAVKPYLTAVSKTSRDYNFGSPQDLTSIETLWIPSDREIFGGTSYEQSGPVYNQIYKNNTSRIKTQNGSASGWWLRSAAPASNANGFRYVNSYGNYGSYGSKGALGVVPGFCLGPDTIHDTWEEISTHITSGDYSTVYSIGDTKAVDMGDQGIICFQIAAFDADVDENGNTIPITWVAQQIMVTNKQMNTTRTNVGGYPASAMKTTVMGYYDRLPATLKSMIVPASKTSKDYNGGSLRDLTSIETLWIPSYREIFGGTSYEQSGPIYSTLFPDKTNRIKKKYGTGRADVWWLRSAYDSGATDFRYIGSEGKYGNIFNGANITFGVVLGFCTGAIPNPVDDGYGVEWNYSQSTTTLTRRGLAANFSNPVPATDLTTTGSSPFDNIEPWASMKRYNIINDEIVPDTDSRFSETDNDTVVYIPEFYYYAEKDTTNSKWLWAISPTAKEGYIKHPGSGRYIGRFHSSGSGSTVFSKSGVAPLANVTRASFRTLSHNKGSKWYQQDLATWSAIQLLYLIEFANWHSQDTLGTGRNASSVQNTGSTTGAVYHTIKRSGASNTYRWIENLFSNMMTWTDGFVASNRKTYITTNPNSFKDTTSGLDDTGITLPSSGYITGIGYSEKCAWAFIPDAASGGSITTHVPDYVFSGTDVRVLNIGGYYSSSGYYGMFYFDVGEDASNAYAYVGSRLLYIPS